MRNVELRNTDINAIVDAKYEKQMYEIVLNELKGTVSFAHQQTNKQNYGMYTNVNKDSAKREWRGKKKLCVIT